MPRSHKAATTPARPKAAQAVLDQLTKVVDTYGAAVVAREAAEKALEAAYAAEDRAREEAARNAIVSPAILNALSATPRRFALQQHGAGHDNQE